MIVNLTSPLRFLIIVPYFLLLIIGLTIPSDGAHGIFSIKSLAFIATGIGVIASILISKPIVLSQIKLSLFFLSTLCFLSLWMLVSILQEDRSSESSIDQLKIVLLTASVVLFSCYLFTEKLFTFQQFLKTILYANFTYSCLKILIIFLHLIGVIDMWGTFEKLGFRFMSMSIIGGLPRIQTSIDIATPFLLFFFLQAHHFGIEWSRRFRIAYLTLSSIALFLSFSRFLIAAGILSFLLHGLTLRAMTVAKLFAVSLLLIIAGFFAVGPDNVTAIIERRLFSTDNYVSDRTRTDQIEALIEEHQQYPWFGKGLGGYTRQSIRDSRLLHSYEVQWVAFLMQFGIIGIALILIALGMIAVQILSPPLTRQKSALFILFCAWLFSGFTNPFLISLTSGILYSLFLLTAQTLKHHESELLC